MATSERCSSLASGSMRLSSLVATRFTVAVIAARSVSACFSSGPETMARAEAAMAERSSAILRKSMPSSWFFSAWMAVAVVGISVMSR